MRFNIQILLYVIQFYQTACITKEDRSDREYLHRLKEGHSPIVVLNLDSTLYFVNSVSMMGFDIHLPSNLMRT